MKKFLTCVVINYNNGKYLERCILSIINQEIDFDMDVLIIDDCSTDNSMEVIKGIKQKRPNHSITVFQTQKNSKLGKFALQNLKEKMQPFMESQYYYKIESDDYIIDNRKFAKQISALEQNLECVAACHGYQSINMETGEKSFPDILPSGIYSAADIINRWGRDHVYTHSSTFMYRNIFKSILPPRFSKLPWAIGDVLYNWEILQWGKVFVSSEVMTVYRLHPNGVWSSKSPQDQERENRRILFRLWRLSTALNRLRISWVVIRKSVRRCLGR